MNQAPQNCLNYNGGSPLEPAANATTCPRFVSRRQCFSISKQRVSTEPECHSYKQFACARSEFLDYNRSDKDGLKPEATEQHTLMKRSIPTPLAMNEFTFSKPYDFSFSSDEELVAADRYASTCAGRRGITGRTWSRTAVQLASTVEDIEQPDVFSKYIGLCRGSQLFGCTPRSVEHSPIHLHCAETLNHDTQRGNSQRAASDNRKMLGKKPWLVSKNRDSAVQQNQVQNMRFISPTRKNRRPSKRARLTERRRADIWSSARLRNCSLLYSLLH